LSNSHCERQWTQTPLLPTAATVPDPSFSWSKLVRVDCGSSDTWSECEHASVLAGGYLSSQVGSPLRQLLMSAPRTIHHVEVVPEALPHATMFRGPSFASTHRARKAHSQPQECGQTLVTDQTQARLPMASKHSSTRSRPSQMIQRASAVWASRCDAACVGARSNFEEVK
jgi:hypothetical protein